MTYCYYRRHLTRHIVIIEDFICCRFGIGELVLAILIVIGGLIETIGAWQWRAELDDSRVRVVANTKSGAGIWCGGMLLIVSGLTINAARWNTYMRVSKINKMSFSTLY